MSIASSSSFIEELSSAVVVVVVKCPALDVPVTGGREVLQRLFLHRESARLARVRRRRFRRSGYGYGDDLRSVARITAPESGDAYHDTARRRNAPRVVEDSGS